MLNSINNFFKGIKKWYDSWFYESGYAEPVFYLFIPFKLPDTVIGEDLLSVKSHPVNIYSIENMTDEDKMIKEKEKREKNPEYTVFFKSFGYVMIDDKIYPELPKAKKPDTEKTSETEAEQKTKPVE